MGAEESQVKIKIITTADPSGVQAARNEYDALFTDLKKGIADTLQAGGADSKFISHVVDEFERLNQELKATGASGDEVAQKIAKLEQQLQATAAAEEKRIQQLRVNFEIALHEKDEREAAEALQRRRREEDQLWMEQEGRRLQQNTEKLEAEIMARLRAERVAREAAQTAQATGAAMERTGQSTGQALLVAGQFFDDMQYGLGAVVGQIPQLAASFGLGAGLAGVIGIAAVAVNLLWDKFGGADEAKAKTDKATQSIDNMRAALDRTAAAASEAFKADLKAYADDVDRVTSAWEKAASELEKVLGYHNELAAIQNKIANSQLEIQRQNALAGAKSDEEKKVINADYDARKAGLNDASAVEQAKRNLEAQQAKDAMLQKERYKNEDLQSNANARATDANTERGRFVDEFGGQSDQGRRVAEAEAAQKRVLELQERQRKQKEFDLQRPAMTSGDAMARAAQAKKLQEEIDAAATDRDAKNAGLEGDKEALRTGNGLTFNRAKDDAKAAQDKGDAATAIGLDKMRAEAEQRQKEIDEKQKAAEADLQKATEALAKLREEQADSAKDTLLKQKQLEAAQLKAEEDAIKAKNAKDQVEKDNAEKAKKKQQEEEKQKREEEALKLENDAASMEGKGMFLGAATKRNQAAKLRLPDDATPEEKRRAEMEAEERFKEAGRKDTANSQKNKGKDIGDKLSTLGENMGEAGKELQEAADKLKDGATEAELKAVLKALQDLAPALQEKYAGQEKKFSEMAKSIETLTNWIKNSRNANS